MTPEFMVAGRHIGSDHPPFVIAEIGINHEGSEDKALAMIDAAAGAGAECVKFQTHIPAEEMIPNDVVPANADQSIWDIISRCTLDADTEARLKQAAEARGLIFISTPFSFAAIDRLKALDVPAFKIGSGECNNLPFVEHVARCGKPVILSTGMNDLAAIARSVTVLRAHAVPFALLHCTSVYPTPPELVRLGALRQLQAAFPDAVIGLSDHTLDNYTCLGAVALGAAVLERHFTADKGWPGPDIEVSMDPADLADLIQGSRTIHSARGGEKTVLVEEEPTIRFAYSSVVTTGALAPGTVLTRAHLTTKRPGTGDIPAASLAGLLGRVVARPVAADQQLSWADLS